MMDNDIINDLFNVCSHLNKQTEYFWLFAVDGEFLEVTVQLSWDRFVTFKRSLPVLDHLKNRFDMLVIDFKNSAENYEKAYGL